MTESPTQSNPPPDGAGLLHLRSCVIVPKPQVTEQSEKTPQLDQPPSTVCYMIVEKHENKLGTRLNKSNILKLLSNTF